MPYWLTNPDHGMMPVYDMGEVERVKKFGWTLLNVGESPIRAPVPHIETVAYADGATATGPAPLPENSPAEQALKASLAESMRLDPPPKRKYVRKAK
jgi:hypothetical protein